MGKGYRHVCHPQMGGGDLLEIGVGVHPAAEPQIGQLGQEITGRRAGVLHPVDVDGPGSGKHPPGPVQLLDGQGLQCLLQQAAGHPNLFQGEVLQLVPGLQVEASQVVEAGLPGRAAAAVPDEAVFEVAVAVKSKGLHEADHCGLAHLHLVCQLRNGAPGTGLWVLQHIVRHPLFRWPQRGVGAAHPVQNPNILPHDLISPIP